MFPACAGMNRTGDDRIADPLRVPRMRGDEPDLRIGNLTAQIVFPACAGMNRRQNSRARPPRGVPRMRGDEPAEGV